MKKILFTSESVSEGHPDKIADQISDAVLDACLSKDPYARVACEVFTTTNRVVVGGEISTTAKPDIEKIVRNVLEKIGYTDEDYGIDAKTCIIQNYIHEQSQDISIGVDKSSDDGLTGAGDQGIMFGYATNETSGYMPMPVTMAHKLVRLASELRKNGEFKWARPDMKSQVTVDYTDSKSPKIDTILMSIQHDPDYNEIEFKKYIKENIMDKVVKSFDMNYDYRVLINPTGRFVIGGPHGDTGLTGRKIIVDTYGGSARHGGGAFSGKDFTKVDRSAAYAARYIAKNIVAAGLADRCEIQLSYAIGVSQPTSISLETFGTSTIDHTLLLEAIERNFDLSPNGIINMLDLRKPIYEQTATYGHFGRPDLDLPWEKLDKVDILRKEILGK